MVVFYVMLVIISTQGVEPVCLIEAKQVENAKICQDKADVYNEDSSVKETADGRYLATIAKCSTDI